MLAMLLDIWLAGQVCSNYKMFTPFTGNHNKHSGVGLDLFHPQSRSSKENARGTRPCHRKQPVDNARRSLQIKLHSSFYQCKRNFKILKIFQEVQRLGNIVAINVRHTVLKDVEVGGHKLEKGTIIIPHIGALMGDPKVNIATKPRCSRSSLNRINSNRRDSWMERGN